MLLALLGLLGCGDSIGTPCQHGQGTFGLTDPCATKCLGLSSMACPDGRHIKAAVCAGTHGCTPGSCPDGQLCYAYPDPFTDHSYCVPEDVCGPLDATAGAAWEAQSAAAWKAEQEKYAKKKPSTLVTKPAENAVSPGE